MKHVKINLSSISTTGNINIIDNSINQRTIDSNDFNITTKSAIIESNYSLYNRCDAYCDDFWTTTAMAYQTPICVDIVSDNTSTSYVIEMTKIRKEGYSWALTSSDFKMCLKDSVIQSVTDVNLCVLSFVFLVSGFTIYCKSNDKKLTESVGTFKKIIN